MTEEADRYVPYCLSQEDMSDPDKVSKLMIDWYEGDLENGLLPVLDRAAIESFFGCPTWVDDPEDGRGFYLLHASTLDPNAPDYASDLLHTLWDRGDPLPDPIGRFEAREVSLSGVWCLSLRSHDLPHLCILIYPSVGNGALANEMQKYCRDNDIEQQSCPHHVDVIPMNIDYLREILGVELSEKISGEEDVEAPKLH